MDAGLGRNRARALQTEAVDSNRGAPDGRSMFSKLRPWHWFVVAIAGVLMLLLLWFGIA